MLNRKVSALFAVGIFGLTSVGNANAQGVTRINRPLTNQTYSSQSAYSRSPVQPWGDTSMRQGRQGKQKKMMLVPGEVAKENIQKVTSEIRWNTNLNSALAQASRQHKMVLWVHLVGNLSGAT